MEKWQDLRGGEGGVSEESVVRAALSGGRVGSQLSEIRGGVVK